MKNTLLNLLYSFCIIILLVFSVIAYHNNNVLESRINSLIKNSKDFSSEKSFKEDYYIKQQSSDTTLLLVVFPIIVGFISLFTYKNILDKVVAYETNINNKIKEKETEWNKNHKRLNNLEFRLIDAQANESVNRFYNSYDKNDFEMALYYALNALSDFSKCYFIENELNDKEFKDGIFEVLNSTLDLLNKQESFMVSIQFKKLIYNSMIVIRNIDNEDVHKKLSLLDSKITYKNKNRF